MSDINRVFMVGVIGALAASGCAADEYTSDGKGRIDAAALEEDGATAVIDDDIATIGVPLATRFPMAEADAIEDEMLGAVSLVVASEASGASADLADGVAVAGEPSAPGEFSWALDDDRTVLTITFFNETESGMSIDRGGAYVATLTIAANTYTAELPATMFDVSVE